MDLASFFNRWPPVKDIWKRMRVAMTEAEIAEYREFIAKQNQETGDDSFFWAVRGVPIVLEDEPTNPGLQVERTQQKTPPRRGMP